MEVIPGQPPRSVRTLFVSDVHLGCRFAQTERFVEYLEAVHPERIYLLGDILDGWKLKGSFRWKPICTRVLNRLMELSHGGTELYYTPGNHDAFMRCRNLRDAVAASGLRIHVADEFIFVTRDGRRFLLTHGDQFDSVEMNYRWLSVATTYIYEPFLYLNWCTSRIVRRPDRSPYSLCGVAKERVKRAVKFVSSFESRVAKRVRERRCDGIICGHIHSPQIVESEKLTYMNTGDWVENCTAIVELHDGTLQLESSYKNRETRTMRVTCEPAVDAFSSDPGDTEDEIREPSRRVVA
ncbi:MAG: UDP-2,3-diacylglucosamine diphosphatase [Planctomycetaceae bacterium]